MTAVQSVVDPHNSSVYLHSQKLYLHSISYIARPEIIVNYYTALLNAVERSIHLHGPSRLPVVNYFSIMTVAMHIITLSRKVMCFVSTPV